MTDTGPYGNGRDVVRYIDAAYLAAFVCLAWGYTFTSSRTGERWLTAELREIVHG